MKILHVSAQKPDSTGSGIYLARTVDAFARMGCQQAVIAGIAPEDAPVFPEGVAFFPVRFETPQLPFPVVGMSDVMPYTSTRYRDMDEVQVAQFKTAFAYATNQALNAFEPDLVVCHHLYLAASVVVRTVRHCFEASGRPQPKVVAISHSTDISQITSHDLERDFIIEGMHLLDEVLALHAPQAAEIARVYAIDPACIRIIGTGYDDGEFFKRDGVRDRGARRLVYVGKIWRRKGVESLIRAISQMPPESAPSETVFIGGYSDQDEYDQALNLAEHCPYPVRFAGKVDQDELVESYQRANVFVLPSFYEGLPLVIIEAMACGCNVVATDLPGIREWLSGHLPDAPIRFVQPPHENDEGAFDPAKLAAFECALSQALADALEAPEPTCDTSVLSWSSVCERILGLH